MPRAKGTQNTPQSITNKIVKEHSREIYRRPLINEFIDFYNNERFQIKTSLTPLKNGIRLHNIKKF